MIEVHEYKYGYGSPLICDGCYRACKTTGSPHDSMYEIMFENGDITVLCRECASQLADKLCGVLSKTHIDPSSESYKAGYRNGYKEGFTDRRELDD